MQREYRHAQLRGLPFPLLWVAETFTIDYEQVRIGRYYRQSGWYGHVFLWLAVPLFVLANVLFQMVIQYGSLFLLLTGLSLLMANLLMTLMRSSVPFSLAFQGLYSTETQFLTLHYSWCFYANLFNGKNNYKSAIALYFTATHFLLHNYLAILCLIFGLVSLIADLRCPDEAADFFGNDVLQSYEDYFAGKE